MRDSEPEEEGGAGAERDEEATCPNCGSARVVPILYGYPSLEMFQAADRGEIALGGCLISGNDPMTLCLNCETSFDFAEPPLSGLAGVVLPRE